MTECGQRAVLLITMSPSDTSTNVARRRVELHCSLPAGHDGHHRDAENNEQWEQGKQGIPMLFRDENDP
jgi:hypothetical protein